MEILNLPSTRASIPQGGGAQIQMTEVLGILVLDY